MSESVSEARQTPDSPAGRQDMSVDLTTGELTEAVAAASSTVTGVPQLVAPVAGVPAGAGMVVGRKGSDFVYYGLRNKKLAFGLGPGALFRAASRSSARSSPSTLLTGWSALGWQHPNGTYWLGTDNLGHDMFSQLD